MPTLSKFKLFPPKRPRRSVKKKWTEAFTSDKHEFFEYWNYRVMSENSPYIIL